MSRRFHPRTVEPSAAWARLPLVAPSRPRSRYRLAWFVPGLVAGLGIGMALEALIR